MPSFDIASPGAELSGSCCRSLGAGEGTWACRRPDGTEGRCCWMSLMLDMDGPLEALCGPGGDLSGPLLEDAMFHALAYWRSCPAGYPYFPSFCF